MRNLKTPNVLTLTALAELIAAIDEYKDLYEDAVENDYEYSMVFEIPQLAIARAFLRVCGLPGQPGELLDSLRVDHGQALQAEIERRVSDAAAVYRKSPIPVELRWAVFRRDNFTCKHCGIQEDLHADHVIPESKGGPTTLENLQTLCRPCNQRKGAGV